MTLEQLYILETIKEVGSFSKASEKLGKAKSAISYSISSLEEELGLLLIDRSKYRPEMTRHGLQLIEKSQIVLREFERLEGFTKNLSQNQELKFHISVTGLWPLEKFIPLLKKLEDKFPETEIYFTREVLSGEKMLKNKSVDFSILSILDDRVNLEYKRIGEIRMPLVIASSHPLASKKIVTRDDLAKFPQIILKSTIQDDDRKFGVLDQGKKWNVSDQDSKLKLILEGLGWGRLPEHLADEYIQRQCLSEIHIEGDERLDYVEVFIARRANDFHGVISNYIWDLY